MSEEQTEPDLGHAVHYNAVPEGATVYDRDNGALGTVRQIVDNYREHILDGVVVAGQDGVVRFVDGPEVGRTFERGVVLTISAAEFAEHGPPEDGPGVFKAKAAGGRFSRFFGGAWKRRR